MIGRVVATTGAVTTPIAAAVIEKGQQMTVSQPTVAFFFGYPFEVAGMISALFGCLAARFWLGAGQAAKRGFRLQLDLPVSGMAVAVSAGIVIAQHPQPIYALLAGAGAGIVGEGIFKIAEGQFRKHGLLPADPPAG